jgi:hypothetical protein
MSDLASLKAFGTELGLTGSELAAFIEKQQQVARDERARERDRDKEIEVEKLKAVQREKDREHEFKLAELQASSGTPVQPSCRSCKDTLKPPVFNDGEDVSAYIIRFERIAALLKWDKQTHWPVQLGSLLKGRALSIYSSLPPAITDNYESLKAALLKGFRQTPDHFRQKFRTARISPDENYAQFATHLSRLFDYWLESETRGDSYESL